MDKITFNFKYVSKKLAFMGGLVWDGWLAAESNYKSDFILAELKI